MKNEEINKLPSLTFLIVENVIFERFIVEYIFPFETV